MRTPWHLARTAAAALAADAKTQAFATTRYGAPLTVYLADTGTAADMPPLPHVLVELDGALDGGTGAPTIDFAISLRVPAWPAVRVSPRMVSVVKARMQDILKDLPSVNFMEVVEDGKLIDRACVVETAAGTVDASVDAQIAAIEKSIRKNFAK